jgi:hypothetical protein
LFLSGVLYVGGEIAAVFLAGIERSGVFANRTARVLPGLAGIVPMETKLRKCRGDFAGLPALCDPLTRVASGACTSFSGNQIPANRLDPVAVALLAQVPLPTTEPSVPPVGSAFLRKTSAPGNFMTSLEPSLIGVASS